MHTAGPNSAFPSTPSGGGSLGPLEDGRTVIIIGGGPAGSSCAITLKMLGRKLGRDINVVLFEGMKFDAGCIKRVGVLAPPLVQTLEDIIGIPFPCQAVERKIVGYYLHAGDARIRLQMGGKFSYVGHNVAIDRYLLDKARELGARVIPGRVKDIRFYPDRVEVEGSLKGMRRVKGDVLVGAFGLDAEAAYLLEQATPYEPPKALFCMVCSIPADPEYLKTCDDYVHVFFPNMDSVEFGVVTPKRTNFVVNMAGPSVTRDTLEKFLSLPELRKIIPPDISGKEGTTVSRPLSFPLGPAQNCFGDRYVTVGDASGLLRAYKGNGINSACATGHRAAEVMLKVGISRRAFEEYQNAFLNIINDLPYGRAVRHMTVLGQKYGMMPGALRAAAKDRVLVNVLIDFVTGSKTYREIVRDAGIMKLSLRFLKGVTISS